MSLTATQRWYVRRRYLEGESVEALALDYKVGVEEIREQTDAVARRAEASVPRAVAVKEPESGFRCIVCGSHRYGLGEQTLLPGTWILRCAKCGRRTGHNAVRSDRKESP